MLKVKLGWPFHIVTALTGAVRVFIGYSFTRPTHSADQGNSSIYTNTRAHLFINLIGEMTAPQLSPAQCHWLCCGLREEKDAHIVVKAILSRLQHSIRFTSDDQCKMQMCTVNVHCSVSTYLLTKSRGLLQVIAVLYAILCLSSIIQQVIQYRP